MKAIHSGLGFIFVLFLLGCTPPPPPPATFPVGTFSTQVTSVSPPPGTTDPLTTPTATPFITVFDGFFNCRFEPSTSSPLVVLLQGQPATVLARNREGWLLVTARDASMPCWVYMGEIPNLNPDDIARLPFYGELYQPANLTFTPIVSATSGPGGPGGHDTPVNPTNTVRPPDTPRPTDTVRPSDTPRPTDTSPPPPTVDYLHKECNDGYDNDNDGRTDMDDNQCSSRGDDSEGS